MLKGNKGEWSEFYTFLKLIDEKKIVGANEKLEKMDSIFFPVLKILREEAAGISQYELQESGKVKISNVNGEIVLVNGDDLKKKIVEIFQSIKDGAETFSVPVAEELIERFQVSALNAGNSSKEDLILRIHDHTINQDHEVGFSIKSRLGSPATLLNASGSTNFIYKIDALSDTDVDNINNIDTRSKIKDRIEAIHLAGGRLLFQGHESSVFERNLRKIDTLMPEIVAQILLGYFSGKGANFSELIKYMSDNDIKVGGFDLSVEDYEYKIKSLLNNAALGMIPATLWDGSLRAHGGVIIVREDGEIVCYHLYNAEKFRDYLFNNTRLETPSSTRHKYGVIYKEDGEMFIRLNLQIRFTK